MKTKQVVAVMLGLFTLIGGGVRPGASRLRMLRERLGCDLDVKQLAGVCYRNNEDAMLQQVLHSERFAGSFPPFRKPPVQ